MKRLAALTASIVCCLAPAVASGAAAPVVAIVDSGVDLRHPALRGATWVNPGEIAGNRVDDDGNGFVDDVNGYDFAGQDAQPRDPRGHGTHVAGIVAARARKARIMAVRVSDRRGVARTDALIAGIDYAAANGADVINVSLAYFPEREAVAAAIVRAGQAGALVVAAAGNGGEDLDLAPAVPAGLGLDNLVSVAALDRDGRLAAWSARGARTVEVAAPGVAVRSTLPGRRYGRLTGTSQSAAHVSGTLARVLMARPGTPVHELRAALVGGASHTRPLRRTVSGGVATVVGALERLG